MLVLRITGFDPTTDLSPTNRLQNARGAGLLPPGDGDCSVVETALAKLTVGAGAVPLYGTFRHHVR